MHGQTCVAGLMRLSQNLLAWYARHGGRTRDALLLPIQSVVTARHLLPLAQLAHELGIDVYYTLSGRMTRGNDVESVRAAFAGCAKPTTTARSHTIRWALIVVADHGHFHPLLKTGSPMAHIGHGNPSKTDREHPGMPWEYSLAPRTRRGGIAYREMIEASDRVCNALVSAEPGLGPRMRVLGRLLDDGMLLRRRRDRSRNLQQLGLDPDRPLLLVASTLRGDSLFGRYWDALLAQLRALAPHYQIMLCPHPGEYAAWAARLGSDADLHMLPVNVNSDQVLPAARLLVVDVSSLCQKAALLGIPMVLAKCDMRSLWPVGATRQLYARWPVWDGSTALGQLVAKAAAMPAAPVDRAIVEWVNSRPGQARKLYTAWLRGYFANAAPLQTPADTRVESAPQRAAPVLMAARLQEAKRGRYGAGAFHALDDSG